MTTKTLATIALVAALGASATPTVTQAQSSRDYIAVVGSSTVYPFLSEQSWEAFTRMVSRRTGS